MTVTIVVHNILQSKNMTNIKAKEGRKLGAELAKALKCPQNRHLILKGQSDEKRQRSCLQQTSLVLEAMYTLPLGLR